MRYSIESADRIFVKDYGFLSFAKKMDKNIGNILSNIWSGKYGWDRKKKETSIRDIW